MSHATVIVFSVSSLMDETIKGKRILEVGSLDENGSMRPIVESQEPAKYIGVDILDGPGVDIVCGAEDVVERFGEESFDIVIANEVFEHVRHWREALSNIKRVCKSGGSIILTTRSKGFHYHGYPHDYWRYEKEDMEHLFSDFTVEKIQTDPFRPGIFIKARKPTDFHEADFANYELYSIISGNKIIDLDEKKLNSVFSRLWIREKVKGLAYLIGKKFLQ